MLYVGDGGGHEPTPISPAPRFELWMMMMMMVPFNTAMRRIQDKRCVSSAIETCN